MANSLLNAGLAPVAWSSSIGSQESGHAGGNASGKTRKERGQTTRVMARPAAENSETVDAPSHELDRFA